MVEHVAQLPHGMVPFLQPFLHRRLLVGFQFVADNLAVCLVRIRHLGVVTSRSRFLLRLGGRGEYQPYRPDEHQHHDGQYDHFLTLQPLCFGQRFALFFRFFPVAGRSRVSGIALNPCFVLSLFHTYYNKV